MSNLTAPIDLSALWRSRLETGDLSFDAGQEAAVKVLQLFLGQLETQLHPAGLLERLFKTSAALPLGVYLWGDVGRGKSMLMDLFFEAIPTTRKRRVHFHSFMLEIHDRLFKVQKTHTDRSLPEIAEGYAKEIKLLCFDEFHVSNIADAMILGRLFEALFAAGVSIVVTSNWEPDNLYRNGLQRERFLPFIDLIKKRMIVHHLEGDVDYRYRQMHGLPVCFFPLGDEATRKLQGIFLQLTADGTPKPITLALQGRTLRIVHTANGVGFFNYEELCGQPLGAADFLAIAGCLHTVLIDGVPKFQGDRRDEVLRFMTLVDALYEAKTKLFLASAGPPRELAPPGEQAFPFQRTVSRLAEMGSEEYRHKAHMA